MLPIMGQLSATTNLPGYSGQLELTNSNDLKWKHRDFKRALHWLYPKFSFFIMKSNTACALFCFVAMVLSFYPFFGSY